MPPCTLSHALLDELEALWQVHQQVLLLQIKDREL